MNTKKGNLATPTGEQAPVNTPEASSGTVSDTMLPQDSENVKVSLSAEADTDYMAAVERDDTDAAQKMVAEAAKAAGYNSPISEVFSRRFYRAVTSGTI